MDFDALIQEVYEEGKRQIRELQATIEATHKDPAYIMGKALYDEFAREGETTEEFTQRFLRVYTMAIQDGLAIQAGVPEVKNTAKKKKRKHKSHGKKAFHGSRNIIGEGSYFSNDENTARSYRN